MKVVCAVFDHKAVAFGDPIVSITEGTVIREFSNICYKKDHPYNSYPHDFELFKLASYDEVTGKIVSLPAPLSLGSAASFLGRSVSEKLNFGLQDQD